MRNVLAYIGALLGVVSLTPYIIDVVKKRTKPNVVTWITWTLLSAVATAAAFAAGQPKTALLTLGYTICTSIIVMLGLKNGIAKFSLFDGLCQASAILGLILWLVFNSPDIAIIAVVIIDFIGVLPTVKHSWQDPMEETWQSFAIGAVASMFIIVSLTTYNIAGLLYPFYLIFGDGLVAFVVIYRRTKLGISLERGGAHKTLHE